MIRQTLENEETARDGIFPEFTKEDVFLISSDSMCCRPGEQLYLSINKLGSGQRKG